jgi:hypothetical protein
MGYRGERLWLNWVPVLERELALGWYDWKELG